jgi:hypothetical protein
MKWSKYHAPNSGISAYAEGSHYILIEFKTGERYRYDESHPGKKHVQEMKSLAHRTAGLTTYINRHVRDNYAAKLSDSREATRRDLRSRPTSPKRPGARVRPTRSGKARRSSRASAA